jgi:nitroimidazol reductase NimA-like FMN-containing flavoprotein (pyridoxamine 5'-phosphate oxidase superfamily)
MTDLRRPALAAISHEDCLALLAAGTVGRVAVPDPGAGPLIVPVNYVFDGGCVVFRTDDGTKLQLLRAGVASFEIDQIDEEGRTGWSVLVSGRAYEASHWETDHLRLEPFAAGHKGIWIRIVPASISGRRVA